MKKTVVMGTLVSALVLGVASFGVAGFDAVYAEEAPAAVEVTAEAKEYIAKIGTLLKQVKSEFGTVLEEDWGSLKGAIYAVSEQCGVTGKGAHGETVLAVMRSIGNNIEEMDSWQMLDAAKQVDEATYNKLIADGLSGGALDYAGFQDEIKATEQDMHNITFGEGDYAEYSIKKFVPSSFDWNTVKDKTVREVVDAVQKIPGLDVYGNLSWAVSSAEYWASVDQSSLTQDSVQYIKATYEDLDKAFVAAQEYVKSAPVDTVVSTEAGGNAIAVEGNLPATVKLEAAKVENITTVVKDFAGFGDKKNVIFDITLKNSDGTKYNLDGSVTVTIDLPEGFDGKKTAVLYIADNGKTENMKAKFVDGKIVFTTTHFSYYAVVEDASLVPGTPNGGAPMTSDETDAVATLSILPIVAGVLAGLTYVGVMVCRRSQQR